MYSKQIFVEIREKNRYGQLSIEELGDFESTNDIKVPEDYRQFLLECNGGIPHPNINQQPETVVAYIFGMHNGDHHASLYKHIDLFKNRIPFSVFPIASDAFGNLFIMSVHPESYGLIYFWDHEGESVIRDGNYTDNCSFVAYTFSEFLNGLK